MDKSQIVNINVFDMNIRTNKTCLLEDKNNNKLEDRLSEFKYYDYVITNPPFGIQSVKSADIMFLEKALILADEKIFSMHKSTTYDFINKFYTSKGVKDIIKHEIQFDIPKTYKFHKEKNKVIKVCCVEANI